MRRLCVGILFLLVASCGKATDTSCSDVLCPGQGRGVCVDLASDSENCGSCGLACPGDEVCEDGVCVEGCSSGDVSCDGVCVDLGSDEANCGACDVVCDAGMVCLGGRCEAACEGDDCEPPTPCQGDDCGCIEGDGCACHNGECACEEGYTQCGLRCIDTMSDRRHCGACASPCSGDLECVEGVCQCPESMVECWFGCLDPSSDPLNCGECGALCENSTFCEQGSCNCPLGLSSCDGTCVDQSASRVHCGACGVECDEGQTCEAGTCTDAPASACPEIPTDVSIERVALYQAVEIPLVEDGVVVIPNDRNADVIREREALVRVFVATEPGFESTTLVAEVHFEGAENASYFSHPQLVTGPSSTEQLESTLNVHVPAAAITADLGYSVSLSACESQTGGSPARVRVPEAGTAPLGARRSGEIDVLFVPIIHDGRAPDTSDSILEAYAREVTRQYPTTALNFEVGEPLVSIESGILPDLGLILDQLTDRRATDRPADNTYYYGIVDPAEALEAYCDGGCTTGIAWWLPSLDDWAIAHRVGLGIGFGTYGANTFAHEIGHTLGRDHAPCNAEGDLFYPYPNAALGVWGYDRVSGTLKAPDAFSDLMSYCEPNWVSDYTYRAIFQRLAATQVAKTRGGPTDLAKETPRQQTWASFVVSGSNVKWGRTQTKGGSPTPTPEHGMVYDVDGLPIADIEVHRLFMADGEGYKVFVPERQPGWFAVGLADGVALPYP